MLGLVVVALEPGDVIDVEIQSTGILTNTISRRALASLSLRLKMIMSQESLFASVERWPFSIWMREDLYAYFVALIFHAFGMALLIGGGVVISLRVLGVGNGAALQKFRGFFPVMWLGATLAIASGLILLSAYPAKALTNPVFAIKFTCLLGAALMMRPMLRTEEPTADSRVFAAVALILWLAGVAAGKLLLHTYTVLMVT